MHARCFGAPLGTEKVLRCSSDLIQSHAHNQLRIKAPADLDRTGLTLLSKAGWTRIIMFEDKVLTGCYT